VDLLQFRAVVRIMTDKRVELSNIAAENQIRPVAIGRKNYMFIGSHKFARIAAMIYSLVAIAKTHSVDPFVYIKDILIQFPKIKIIKLKTSYCQTGNHLFLKNSDSFFGAMVLPELYQNTTKKCAFFFFFVLS